MFKAQITQILLWRYFDAQGCPSNCMCLVASGWGYLVDWKNPLHLHCNYITGINLHLTEHPNKASKPLFPDLTAQYIDITDNSAKNDVRAVRLHTWLLFGARTHEVSSHFLFEKDKTWQIQRGNNSGGVTTVTRLPYWFKHKVIVLFPSTFCLQKATPTVFVKVFRSHGQSCTAL